MNRKKWVKYFLYLFCIFCILVFADSSIEKTIGGNFSKTPSEIHANLSEGAQHLIEEAYEGLDSGLIQDYHTHILGVGEGNSGNFVNEEMLSLLHFGKHLKFKIYMNAAGIENEKKADSEYLERLVELIKNNPLHGKYCLLAFDKNYNRDGTPNLRKTEFYVPNEYVFQIAEKYPDFFYPVISVHPYRKDALEELEKWAKKGGRMVKWLPNAMSIDPSEQICQPFYQKMRELNLILLTHAGEEKAVEAEEDQKMGNPLLLRKPLDAGVKVIVAHCASLGEGLDSVMDNNSQKKSNFELFMSLMQEKKYENLLFGDISAMTQFNRVGMPLSTMIDNVALHGRLVNGSDYPLPAINVVIRTKLLVEKGYILADQREYLNEIYQYNPLLFDFVLKRTLHSPITNRKFANSVFMSNKRLGF